MSTPLSVMSIKEEPGLFEVPPTVYDTPFTPGENEVFIKTEIDLDEKSNDAESYQVSIKEEPVSSEEDGECYSQDLEPKLEPKEFETEGEQTSLFEFESSRTSRYPDTLNKGQSNLLCPKCGRHFMRYKPFMKHKAHCTFVFGFECELCPLKAKSLTCLKNHIAKQHQEHEEALRKVKQKVKEAKKKNKSCSPRSRHLEVACLFCKKTYKSIKYLKRHMKRQCLYTCQHCEFSCTQRKSFRIHSLAVHNLDIIPSPSSKFRCGLCGKKFINNFSIEQHCKVGCYPLAENYNMFEHYKKKLEETRQFILKKAIEEITNNGVSSQLPTTCPPCDLPVPIDEIKVECEDPVEEQPALHPATCGGVNLCENQCTLFNPKPDCTLSSCKDDRWKEFRTNWGVEDKNKWKGLVTCTMCPMKFHNGRALSLHMSMRHGPKLRGSQYPGPWFICETCGCKYQSKKSLSIHLKYECNIEPEYECHYCGRRFHRKIKLAYHIQRDSCRRQQFQCPNLCGGFFTQPYSFLRHLRTVCTRSTTFTCSQCSKVFFRKDNLVAHLKRHRTPVVSSV